MSEALSVREALAELRLLGVPESALRPITEWLAATSPPTPAPTCPTEDCAGDLRYAAHEWGSGHREGCSYPTPTPAPDQAASDGSKS